MQNRTTDTGWNRKKKGGSKMNRCEWYWGRKTHRLLGNEEKVTRVGFEHTEKCVNLRARPVRCWAKFVSARNKNVDEVSS